MANEIYLSPRKILEHLCVLEKKIPRKSNVPYHPTGSLLNSEAILNYEVKAMLSHIGMSSYVPICTFASLQDGIAGCVEIGGQSSNLLKIKVDEKYRGNNNIILAILAHEICHKLIYIHGIDFPMMQIANEVYTDLCTLYVGFGELIVQGYKTTTNSPDNSSIITNMLGYLKYDMYIDTYEIIRCIYGGYSSINNTQHDILLNDIINIFNSTKDKKSLIINSLKEKESELSELHRDLIILEQVLERAYMHNKEEVDFYSNVALESGLFDNSPNTTANSIRTLKSLYDLNVGKDKQSIMSVIKWLEQTISFIWSQYSIDEDSINYGVVKCPSCGYMSKFDIKNHEISLIKCHKCNLIFVKNSAKIDIVRWHRERNESFTNNQRQIEWIKEQTKEIQAKQAQLRNESLILNQDKQQFSTYKISIEEQNERKIEQQVQKIRQEVLQEGKLQMWNDMPLILKWLTKKYVTKKS